MHIGDNKLAITTKPKNFHFDLLKYTGISLKHEICYIKKNNDLLAEHTIKNEIIQLFSRYNHRNDIHWHRNSKTIDSHKVVLNLSQQLDLRSSNKHVALQTCLLITLGKIKDNITKRNLK